MFSCLTICIHRAAEIRKETVQNIVSAKSKAVVLVDESTEKNKPPRKYTLLCKSLKQ